jgi:hypothetical protein
MEQLQRSLKDQLFLVSTPNNHGLTDTHGTTLTGTEQLVGLSNSTCLLQVAQAQILPLFHHHLQADAPSTEQHLTFTLPPPHHFRRVILLQLHVAWVLNQPQ